MYDFDDPIDFSVVDHFEDAPADETPGWTARRVLYLIIALLMILAFLFYMLYPLLSGLQNQPQYMPMTDDYQQTLLLLL